LQRQGGVAGEHAGQRSLLVATMRLAIGCPVLQRDWVLQPWFDHLEVALDRAGVTSQVEWVFAGNPDTDESTWDVINQNVPRELLHTVRTEGDRRVVMNTDKGKLYIRNWKQSLYQRMADLRNQV